MSLDRPSRYSPLYRTVCEPTIIETLLLEGFAYEMQAGGELARQARASTQEALEAWLTRGLECRRRPDGTRLFDPVEVMRFMIQESLAGRDPAWLDRWVGQARRLVTDLLSPDELEDRRTPPRRFEVELQRTFKASTCAGTLRLRAPLPIPAANLGLVEMGSLTHLDPTVRLRVSEGRMEARLSPPLGREVTLSARLNLLVHHQSGHGPEGADANWADLSAADRTLYLRPREGFIALTDRVAALAQSLAGDKHEPAAAIAAFWNYILDNLHVGPMHYDQVDPAAPADWTLDNGWCDCQLGSAFLVSLCRAAGLPARLLSGYFLYGLMPVRHYWSEIWTEGQGWAPYDLFSWRLSAGGRDPLWRDYFAGRADYRLTTERFPLTFTGAIGVAYPPIWHMVATPEPGGAAMTFADVDDAVFYRDRLRVGRI